MAWMLQPHNWTQAVKPNLYNVAYRRNLAYKGMGGLGQFPDCSVDPNAPGCTAESPMPPITSPQAAGGGSYAAGQLSYFPTGSVGPSVQLTPYGSVPATTTTATNWLPLVIGGLLLVLLIGGRR